MNFPIQDWVAHHARTRPQQIALRSVETQETRSWAELEERVSRLAHALVHEHRLAKGSRVALISDGDIRVLELQFACIRAGLVFVPLNFRLAPAELAAACMRLDVRLVVSDAIWLETAVGLAETLGAPAPLCWGSEISPYELSIQRAESLGARQDMSAEDVVMILFTSGSTAEPKAAITTLGAMLWQSFNQADVARVAEQGAHVYTCLPLFHAGGLHSLTNPVLFFGGTVSLSARFDPDAAVQVVGNPANGVTHIVLVPLMYALASGSPSFAAADFSRLREAVIAGGRVSRDLQETWAAKGVFFSAQYGGTETGPSVLALSSAKAAKLLEGSCGQPVLHVEIRLVDDEGRDVVAGEAGEIWVRGPAITPGYIGRQAELDFADGWFRTGDIAYADTDGYYFLVDRKKDMYKSGGENVSSAEVEALLAEHPLVAEVSVIGIPHEKWGEVGLAIVVAKPDSRRPSIEDLRRHCEGRLARYKQPFDVTYMDALPRNVTGKVAKEALRQTYGGSRRA